MEWLKMILTGGVGSAIVVGIFAIAQWLLARRASKADRADARQEAAKTQTAIEMQELNRKMDVLFLADRTILYDRIKYLAKSYLNRGYVTVEDLEDLNRMHSVYHDADKLNGNGFLKELMEKVNTTLEIRAR